MIVAGLLYVGLFAESYYAKSGDALDAVSKAAIFLPFCIAPLLFLAFSKRLDRVAFYGVACLTAAAPFSNLFFFAALGWALYSLQRRSAGVGQKYFDIVGAELKQEDIKPGLWARSIAESGSDDSRAKAIYIRHRAEELRESDENAKIGANTGKAVARVGLINALFVVVLALAATAAVYFYKRNNLPVCGWLGCGVLGTAIGSARFLDEKDRRNPLKFALSLVAGVAGGPWTLIQSMAE